MVFPYDSDWEGQQYPEKEVTVHYRLLDQDVVLLNVKARYRTAFQRF
jgi:hypothetical protein